MTIRVSEATKAKLERLANATRRSDALLAAEALSAYVDHELEIIEGIQAALDDADAGRLVSHEDAMSEVYSVIRSVERR